MRNREELYRIVDEIKLSLGVMAESGWQGFDCASTSLDTIDRWGLAKRASAERLPDVRSDLGDCTRCRLAGGRTHIVFGAGHPNARLMFVGEGPGYDEDRMGEPFVGAAGQLLTKIIQAMGLSRDDVYIANIVKCRPPKNRNPRTDEMAACLPFLRRQITAVAPEYICALGTVATQALLDTEETISRLRGRFHDMTGGVRVMPTYHPAYLLRNVAKKKEVWADIQKLMKAMGLQQRA
jgi:DNA polymerase